jgi:G:T-mismatch repair DNA endonuclease (very short patch repair protein)
VNREHTDGCKILHGGNGREYRLPDFPNLSVDEFCVETRTVYEILGCFWHGHTCLKFRDVTMSSGETLAERYEKTM